MGKDVTDMGQKVTDVGLEESSTKKELKKHAATIHCSNTLSLLQRKVSNALLYHAYKELMQKEEHEITVKQLCRLIGYHGNNHAAIRDALRCLISTVIEWNLIDAVTGAENWTASSIIASVSLEGPLCYYAYSPRMKQLLHSPSMFGKIDLVIQSKFRSSYGLALYENCIRYIGLPHTKWFEIDLFRKLMGVPPGVYDVFRDFKRRVLDKAIQEVNSHSDLVLEPEYVKEGRRVARVRFKLSEREKKKRLGQLEKVHAARKQHQDVKSRLVDEFALSKKQIEKLFDEHEPAYILEKMNVIETSRPFQEGKIKNRPAYLLSAIRDDYRPPKSMTIIQFDEIRQEAEMVELKRHVEYIREKYNRYREKTVKDALAALSDDEKKNFMKGFMNYAEPVVQTVLQLQRNKYTRETVLDSPQLKAMLRCFALRELDLSSFVTMEEFIVSLDEKKREAWHRLKSLDPDHELLNMGQ
jgi:hypothetical protein